MLYQPYSDRKSVFQLKSRSAVTCPTCPSLMNFISDWFMHAFEVWLESCPMHMFVKECCMHRAFLAGLGAVFLSGPTCACSNIQMFTKVCLIEHANTAIWSTLILVTSSFRKHTSLLSYKINNSTFSSLEKSPKMYPWTCL